MKYFLPTLLLLAGAACSGGSGASDTTGPEQRILAISAGETVDLEDNLAARGRHPSYYAPMITMLEGEDGELRARSAATLARLATKATITRPEFWRHGPEDSRRREVAEWQRWLADRQ